MNIQHNIFNYATKELSHDAFLAYVFVNYQKNFEIFKNITNKFIGTDVISDSKKVKNVQAIKQFESIDLLIELELTNEDNKRLIVIENKTRSDLHDNQLERYKEKLEKKNCKYLDYNKSFIYYKLDFKETNIHNKFQGWKRLYIEDIIEMVKSWKQLNYNDLIIDQYIEYLDYINRSINKIPTDLADWNYYSFKSFMLNFITSNNIKNAAVDTFRGKWMSFNIDKNPKSNKDFYFEYAHDLNSQKRKTEIIASKKGFHKKFKNFCNNIKNFKFFKARSSRLPIGENTENPYIARYDKHIETENELRVILKELVKEYLSI